MAPWCSGLTRLPVKEEIGSSNLLGVAIKCFWNRLFVRRFSFVQLSRDSDEAKRPALPVAMSGRAV